MLTKVRPGDAQDVMATLEDAWSRVIPNEPFEATFLNEELQQLYDTERRVGRMIGGFAGLAVLVACLGLIGLATYTTQQRMKEIGIRKALGASVPGIVTLLSRDFLKLVVLAVVIASPIGYWIAEQWLEQFAYRITPGVTLFAGAAAIVILIAGLSVSVQTIRAARTRPAHVIRSE
jgi:putative ABC transport system permease protein